MRIKVIKSARPDALYNDSLYISNGKRRTLRKDIPELVPNPDYVPPSSVCTENKAIKAQMDRITAERDVAIDVLYKLEKLGIPTLEAENIVPGSVRRQNISPDGRYKMVSFIIAT